MTYISGFLAAVPDANKDAYIEHARRAWPLFAKRGALSMMEGWGDQVPDGKLTSFPMAVKKEDEETVVFSWITWPDRATWEACMASMESDADWEGMMDMPFDGKRMVWGGFEAIVERSAEPAMT